MPSDLKQVLGTLQSGNWFSCRFITADQAKQTGGDVVNLKKCRLAKRQRVAANAMLPTASAPKNHKDPLHNYHFTRNVELENGILRKVHPLLIIEINGLPVI